jgi:hypothetical protein
MIFLYGNGKLTIFLNTVFLLIWKRDRDRCVHKRLHKNDRQ